MQAQATATRQDVVSEVASVNVMKHTIRTSVSSILYLRNVFEEDAFTDKTVAGLTLKSLNNGISNPQVLHIHRWLEEGVFDAVQKGYLSLMVLGIHDAKDKLLEAYQFKVESGEIVLETETGGRRTKGRVKADTANLLRDLIGLTQDLPSLPESRYVSTTLRYNELCPKDYFPPHFRETKEGDSLVFDEIPKEADIGILNTGHQVLKIRLKTLCDGSIDPADIEHPMCPSQVSELRRPEVFYTQEDSQKSTRKQSYRVTTKATNPKQRQKDTKQGLQQSRNANRPQVH